ncbi:MAG: hypothetical protein GFH27_549283n407 [Chloroflexi bacterium AL-W]|nr:hypothetical protein [Chloroflexi bacterium AL-N1]NOK64472.1 hypothetical protein [Chloroflexi bacterium AL-N10]NOK75714.1 hypothetical protein [Chloroflexi bacterium AL-N5]NOK80528.1 hypothetical protein [Chloroflexi bacterium AL-W]NOK87042.1 hypothetical protein [Chloroflexi bacterium AL-N15]
MREAHTAGCPRDQIENFLRAGVVLQPQQLVASAAARLCDLPGGPTQIGFGGARGGGKSHWGVVQTAADDAQRYPGLKILFLRKVGKSLKEGFADLLRNVAFGIDYRFVPSESTVYFPNGSRVLLGHFQKESDIDAYLGIEYDVIVIEEATTLSASKVKAIRTCLRTSKPGWRPRLYSTTNPGGIGHAWYKHRFIEPYRKKCETDTRYIPATVDDNAFVNPEYKATLDTLTGWMLRAWRYGDWDIAAGQYFVTWRRDIHVIKPFPRLHIPSNWRVWCSLDYGFNHYTVCHLLTEGDGNVYLLDEHAARQWLVPRHAEAIKAMLARWHIDLPRLSTFVAGGDVFRREHTGGTVAKEYRKHGIKLRKAKDDRVDGATEMLSRLGDVDANIAPTLYVTERCTGFIETLPMLEHDPKHVEDVLKVDVDEDDIGGDDFYDCGRYGVMGATRPRMQSAKIDLYARTGKTPSRTGEAPSSLRTDTEIAALLDAVDQ